MRPTYESQQDRDNEADVARVLANAWRCRMQKMPAFYQVDWAAVGSTGINAWIEIKCRTNARGDYPTLILSLHKWMHGMYLAEQTGKPFILVARWTDGIYYTKGSNGVERRIDIGGRQDRGDPQDMEPVIHIPVNTFLKVGK